MVNIACPKHVDSPGTSLLGTYMGDITRDGDVATADPLRVPETSGPCE